MSKSIKCCLHTCSCGERLPILKAQQRVIKAAKRWLKAWKSGEITQAEPKTFIDEQDHPADTKLAKAVDALIKLEKKG